MDKFGKGEIMGAGQSDLYKGTYGDNPDSIPDELKGEVKLPSNDAQLRHIFREKEGHLKDTVENRKTLLNLANDMDAHVGKDARGNDWHMKINEDGSQLWVETRDGVIRNGGLNNPPKPWDEDTGLKYNPFRK